MDAAQNGNGTQQPGRGDDADTVVIDAREAFTVLNDNALTEEILNQALANVVHDRDELRRLVRKYFEASAYVGMGPACDRAFTRAETALRQAVGL